MLLVEPTRCIVVHLEGHVIDDVADAFAGDGALRRSEHGLIDLSAPPVGSHTHTHTLY